MVRCKICGKEFREITWRHLKKEHNGMTLEEYKKLPDPFEEDNIMDSDSNEITDQVPVVNTLSSDEINKAFEDKFQPLTEQDKKVITNFEKQKNSILNIIREKYPDAVPDYFINLGPRGVLVTDFASPSAKVVFNFPDAFWHNYNISVGNSFSKVLSDNGWKVFDLDEPDFSKE